MNGLVVAFVRGTVMLYSRIPDATTSHEKESASHPTLILNKMRCPKYYRNQITQENGAFMDLYIDLYVVFIHMIYNVEYNGKG